MMTYYLKTYCLVIFALSFCVGKSQQQIQYFINGQLNDQYKLNSSLEINALTNQYWLNLINEGFLNSSIDSTKKDSSDFRVYISKGDKIQLEQYFIQYDSNQKMKFGDFNFNKLNKFSYEKLKKTIDEILSYLNRIGYPFARINLHNSLLDSNSISIQFNINEGLYVKVDSIFCPGLNNKEKSLIKKLIGINHGDPFNSSKIQEISRNLNSVNYMLLRHKTDLLNLHLF